MVELKCPNCNANIELDETRKFGFCCYCGTKVLIEEKKKAIDGIAGIESLLRRGNQFMDSYQVSRAEEYYNKVLDIDPNNQIAQEGLNKINRYRSPLSVLSNMPNEIIDGNCPICNRDLLLDKKIGFIICPVCGASVTEETLNNEKRNEKNKEKFTEEIRKVANSRVRESNKVMDSQIENTVRAIKNEIRNASKMGQFNITSEGKVITGKFVLLDNLEYIPNSKDSGAFPRLVDYSEKGTFFTKKKTLEINENGRYVVHNLIKSLDKDRISAEGYFLERISNKFKEVNKNIYKTDSIKMRNDSELIIKYSYIISYSFIFD